MSKQENVVSTGAPTVEDPMTHDGEKQHVDDVHLPGDVRSDWREQDFMTRNGLNLKSFGRRDYGTGDIELDRSMKKRHLHMIAIGGSIGAGFFVGSGQALTRGGPGSIFLCFSIAGIMIFNVVHALGELAVMYPVSGGFYTYSTRFIDPSWGFAMGWNYVFQWLIVLPFELVVCSFTVAYWDKETSAAAWVTLFWVVIIVVNIFGTLGYAEEEFWSSCFKLAAIVIFMFIAVILICGGGPSNGKFSEYWGARFWYEPGAFQNGFSGFCGVFVTAAFSYSGSELVGLAAAESNNPAKALPGAIKQVFWRITLFYVVGLSLVGMLVSSTDDRLLGAVNAYKEGTSPFVLAGKDAGLRGYDHFMNVVICISVVSIGVSCVYGGSRTLSALAQQGYAPKIFTFVDRSGRPLYSVLFLLAFGPLAYIVVAEGGMVVFDWLLALSGLAALFTWGSICLCHIRFRTAWNRQGRSMDRIPFKAAGGIYGSYMGLTLCALILIATIYSAFVPPGGLKGKPVSYERVLQTLLAIPVVLVFWIAGYFWKKDGWLKIDQIDLDVGLREHDWDEINAYRAKVAAWPAWRRALHKMF
ncbi:amino-acid permease inda1 [Plectosphaerella plurivora]|uniref:Amino-acid permease inda1 n=1 Tax=Plectosphaerella plurivora TaxID=936078 RepID=A0A9P8V0R4_9PEZI|nr:amino-acid permease inda1 [Plectosphaerella plurivora]